MTNRLVTSIVILTAMSGHSEPLLANNRDLRLPSATFPTAMALYESNQPVEALNVLEKRLSNLTSSEVPIEAQLFRATLLSRLGRHRESETIWEETAKRESSLILFTLEAIVSSLAERSEPKRAEARLAKLIKITSVHKQRDLILAVARSHHFKGNLMEAAALYTLVTGSPIRDSSTDTARIGLAETKESAGNLKEATKIFRQVQLQHHTPKAFMVARKGEQRIAASLNQSIEHFTEVQYRALVRHLNRASQHDESLRLLEEWKGAYPETQRLDVIEAEIINTLYGKRNNKEAVIKCLRFAELFPGSTLLSRVRIVQFLLDARMGQTAGVMSRGYDIWQNRIEHTTAEQRRNAGELLATYLVSIGNVKEGLDVYRELFRTAATLGDQRNILWRAGIAALRAGQDERAAINLRGLSNRNPTGELALAARYWLAVAEDRTGKSTEAEQLFHSLKQQHPYHYYGLLAHDRLSALAINSLTSGEEITRRKTTIRKFPVLELGKHVLRHTDFKAAKLLAKAGLKSSAAALARQVLAQNRQNNALALLAARASAEAEDYHDVSTILANHFGTYLSRPTIELPKDFWNLVYPRPFWKEIQASANTHDVDPILLLAVMRQESRFDTQARSSAGAVGLFQIMPYTAAEFGPQNEIGDFVSGKDEELLIEPSLNVSIAATLISKLTTLFGRARAPIVASYNAGEDRVSAWWNAANTLDEDIFVDSIPYLETRRFVREVLANYSAYSRIYWPPE